MIKRLLLLSVCCFSSAALAIGPISGGGGGSGDALTTSPLSQFAPTTSSQLKGVLSDENAPDGASSKFILALGSLSIATGKTATVSNTLTLAGTDSTTMTFPSTSATIARTDAANTFTGHQTIEGVATAGATGTGNLVFATAPTIAGGAHTAITGLGIRSTGAAFDLTLASSEVLTAGRTLSLNVGDAARTITLSGSPTLSGITTTGTGTLALGAKTLTASNTLTLAGTDSTTMTFPSTSATIARTDAANTFTGHQTIEGVTSTGATGTAKFVFDTAPTIANPTLAAGSTSLAALTMTSQTLKTTPAAGDVEMDATNVYNTTDAGNRGYVPVRYIIRAHSTVTQANDGNAHAIFTTPTNGRLTVAVGTYRFHGQLAWSSMSATSGNVKVDVLGAGTAVTTNWLWYSSGFDGTLATQGNGSTGVWNTSASNASITSAGTATACDVMIDGMVEVTTGGTLIPTQTLVTAAAAVLSAGSYIEFWRVGTATSTSIGAWD